MTDIKPVPQHTFPQTGVEEEQLTISSRKDQSSVWAVKIPRFLLERWERVEEAGVELGSLVIDNSVTPARISLRLKHPEEEDKPTPTDHDDHPRYKRAHGRSGYDTSGIPDEYSVNVPADRSKNTFVFCEKKRQWGSGVTGGGGGEDKPRDAYGKRKRDKAIPTLIGKVAHECHIQPLNNEKYLKILEQRRLESESSRRPIVKLEETGISQARVNQLNTGYAGQVSTFGSKMIASAKVNAGERHARLERHELIDRIFALFREKPYWGIPALKATLKQPDQWLREVLRDVAVQIKEGQYLNMWELKGGWKDGTGRVDGEGEGSGSGNRSGDRMQEDEEADEDGDRKPDIGVDEEDEDEDFDEDDFEEVI